MKISETFRILYRIILDYKTEIDQLSRNDDTKFKATVCNVQTFVSADFQ